MNKHFDKYAELSMLGHFDTQTIEKKYRLTKRQARNFMDLLSKQKMIFKLEPWVVNYVKGEMDKYYHVNKLISYTLPLPPTDNRRLMPNRQGRLILTTEYRKWKLTSEDLFYEQRSGLFKKNAPVPFFEPSYDDQLCIDYSLTLPDKRTDIGNYEKALKDFYKGKIYKDDKWVKFNLILPVKVDKENPNATIYIWIEKERKKIYGIDQGQDQRFEPSRVQPEKSDDRGI